MSELKNPQVCAQSCPCTESCPLSAALDTIGGKWKMPILCALVQDGPTRYNQLKRKISAITNTMLASSLKELEADGLIARYQYMEMPVRVEYSVTPEGERLIPILGQFAQWGASLKSPQDRTAVKLL